MVGEAGFEPAISCFQGRRVKPLPNSPNGAADRNRTCVLLVTSEVLDQRELQRRGGSAGDRTRNLRFAGPALSQLSYVTLGDGPRRGITRLSLRPRRSYASRRTTQYVGGAVGVVVGVVAWSMRRTQLGGCSLDLMAPVRAAQCLRNCR